MGATELTDPADHIVVYGSTQAGGHTWTAREDQAVHTLARAIVFTAIDELRDTGWDSDTINATLAPHDWQVIDDAIDQILLQHKPETASAIEAAIAVLIPRVKELRP
ncbi:MAG: hypothetical protein HIU88_10150 [Acidobacteria bacterium]|nr:hypothetical protein [Acidobacteriota bacterium]